MGILFGGVTSAVVGLPVDLALGMVSGLGVPAGMYGAIAVGLFAAVFVSGEPTARSRRFVPG